MSEDVRAEMDELELLRATLQCSPLATMCVSATSVRYAFLNQAYADLLGRTREDLLNSDAYQVWLDVTHPDDLDTEREAIERIASGEIASFELEKRLCSGGKTRWVKVRLCAIRHPDGRLAYTVAYFQEIDEQLGARAQREGLEARLRQAEKLGALGKLAGGVAHDFNNRLVIVMGHTELLKRALPENSPLAVHADMVMASAQRASELTRQLLAYSQRQVLAPQSFDLNQTVERMRRLLERVIGDNIELVSELGATQPIYSDPGQIEQVIMNLAINARDAMPAGGRLILETRDVRLGPGESQRIPEGDYVLLAARDTGTGISGEVLPHIFEPFFTTKEVGKGSGLGLSTVEGIVHQSGGELRVESRVGVGTTFYVYLPRGDGRAVPARYATTAAPPSDVCFETVLICDDDDAVRELMAGVLGFRAYSVLKARNGSEALDLVERHPGRIDLLVADLVMPGMGGVELGKRLRARDPALKILYISGYSGEPVVASSLVDERTRFLAKPFLPGDLTRVACALLEGEKHRC